MSKPDIFGVWNFNDLFNPRSRVERKNSDAWSVVTTTHNPLSRNVSTYRTSSDSSGMKLEVDLPGFAASAVDVSAEGNTVTVVASIASKNYTNRYTVDAVYDVINATATMSNGLLVISIPRKGSQSAVRVTINVIDPTTL